jgi:hypothetical protein
MMSAAVISTKVSPVAAPKGFQAVAHVKGTPIKPSKPAPRSVNYEAKNNQIGKMKTTVTLTDFSKKSMQFFETESSPSFSVSLGMEQLSVKPSPKYLMDITPVPKNLLEKLPSLFGEFQTVAPESTINSVTLWHRTQNSMAGYSEQTLQEREEIGNKVSIYFQLIKLSLLNGHLQFVHN